MVFMAPEVGLEPTTLRLTAECSAIELLRSVHWAGTCWSRAAYLFIPKLDLGVKAWVGIILLWRERDATDFQDATR